MRKGKRMSDNYNGWHNRETWATMLHIDNDRVLLETAMDYARTTIESHKDEEKWDAIYCLEESLMVWITEDLLTRENIAGNEGLWMMLSDIGSLYRVNFGEIAEALIDRVKEEEVANV